MRTVLAGRVMRRASLVAALLAALVAGSAAGGWVTSAPSSAGIRSRRFIAGRCAPARE